MATLVSGARTDATEVKEVIDTSLTDAQVNAFINTANRFIAEAELSGHGVASATLTEIEKYLAAHFLSLRDQRVASEAFPSGFRLSYQGKTGMGLDGTQYGQMAKALDSSGRLATFTSGLKQARWKVYDEDDID